MEKWAIKITALKLRASCSQVVDKNERGRECDVKFTIDSPVVSGYNNF